MEGIGKSAETAGHWGTGVDGAGEQALREPEQSLIGLETAVDASAVQRKPGENLNDGPEEGDKGKSGTKEQEEGHRSGLSKRLRMLADMVTPGNRLADVGCDHGYLSIALVREGICPEAIAMDVREGPLAAAKAHVKEWGLDDYISVRLSDGLAECGIGEADTCVCAGMGGKLMERILRQEMEKARALKELILQPQSELSQFRIFLREAGFRILQEDAVLEEGKYYFGMKAAYGPRTGGTKEERSGGEKEIAEGGIPGSGQVDTGTGSAAQGADAADSVRQHVYDLYGESLLLRRHPVLLQYLIQRQRYVGELKAALAAADSRKARLRLEELCNEMADIETALAFYEGA